MAETIYPRPSACVIINRLYTASTQFNSFFLIYYNMTVYWIVYREMSKHQFGVANSETHETLSVQVCK